MRLTLVEVEALLREDPAVQWILEDMTLQKQRALYRRVRDLMWNFRTVEAIVPDQKLPEAGCLKGSLVQE